MCTHRPWEAAHTGAARCAPPACRAVSTFLRRWRLRAPTRDARACVRVHDSLAGEALRAEAWNVHARRRALRRLQLRTRTRAAIQARARARACTREAWA